MEVEASAKDSHQWWKVYTKESDVGKIGGVWILSQLIKILIILLLWIDVRCIGNGVEAHRELEKEDDADEDDAKGIDLVVDWDILGYAHRESDYKDYYTGPWVAELWPVRFQRDSFVLAID